MLELIVLAAATPGLGLLLVALLGRPHLPTRDRQILAVAGAAMVAATLVVVLVDLATTTVVIRGTIAPTTPTTGSTGTPARTTTTTTVVAGTEVGHENA